MKKPKAFWAAVCVLCAVVAVGALYAAVSQKRGTQAGNIEYAQTKQEAQEPPADGLVENPLGNTAYTGRQEAFAIAEAEYPAMPAYPHEEDFFDPETGEWDDTAFDRLYDPWWEAQRARWADENYAGGLEGFFAASVRQFLGGAEGENRICSPVNLCLSLAMLAELTDGGSRQQILELLAQPSLPDLRAQAAAIWKSNYCDDGASASILANALWLNEDIPFVSSTMETLAQDYYASSYQGKMGSEAFDQALRDWLNQQTGGLLEEQSAGLHMDPNTVLALSSTIYFRARWQHEFWERNTAPQVFHSPAGDLTCDFLRKPGHNGTYFWGERFAAVSEPLDNYSGTMWFLLPDEGVTAEELLEDPQIMEFLLMDAKWEQWPGSKYLIINLAIPKFDVSSDLDLISGLRALGITDVFDPSVSNFSPMTEEEGVYLSQAKHAARVAIDEEGVTAAAYTVMPAPGATGMLPEEEVDFVLDRPFLFAITGVDNLPLFVGLVNRPV